MSADEENSLKPPDMQGNNITSLVSPRDLARDFSKSLVLLLITLIEPSITPVALLHIHTTYRFLTSECATPTRSKHHVPLAREDIVYNSLTTTQTQAVQH